MNPGITFDFITATALGGSIAVASVIGFLMGDSITFMKLLGLAMIIIGAGILASVT